MRHSEVWLNAPARLDLDPVDEGAKKFFDHPRRSLLHGFADLGRHGREVVAFWKGGGGGSDLGGEVVTAVEQLLATVGQFLDTLPADGGGQVTGLEGAQVAVEGAGGIAQLGIDARELLLTIWTLLFRLRDGVAGSLLEEVEVGVNVDDQVDQRPLEVLGRQPLARAGAGALGAAGAADVAAVEATAPVGTSADVSASAAHATEQPAEQVFGAVGRWPGVFVALGEEILCLPPEIEVHDGFVLAVVDVVAVPDLADVDGVAQNSQYSLRSPEVAAACAPAAVVQPAGDGSGPQPLADVLWEDRLHDGGFVGMGSERLGGRVEAVAKGAGSAEPLAPGGLALETPGDAVDEQPALEFGEDAEQLQKEPADRSLRVYGFGSRFEVHAGRLELVHDGHEADDRAGQPVNPVHKEYVVRPLACQPQRLLEAGSLQGRAGGLIDEAMGDMHAWL